MKVIKGLMVLNTDQENFKIARKQLETPALVVDQPTLNRNINKMAAYAKAHDVNLRPHIKAHKCLEIAGLQLSAGAMGLSCATLGEAEMIARFYDASILITSPLVAENKILRLVEISRNYPMTEFMVVCDNLRNLSDLAEAAMLMRQPLGVLIDLDVGQRRTGVSDGNEVVNLARRMQTENCLILQGLQAYAGHIQHIPHDGQRYDAAREVHNIILQTVEIAAQNCIQFEIISGGGTGTHHFDAPSNVFTELQPGSYVFMDDEYRSVLANKESVSPFEISLRVQATVVSTNRPEWIIVDAGTKSFATDSGPPVIDGICGEYYFSGDEHGKVAISGLRPDLGAQIRFITPHCDPTVNLYDVLHVFEEDLLIDIWKINARGKW